MEPLWCVIVSGSPRGLGWRTAGSPLLGTPRLRWGKFHCLSLSAEGPPAQIYLETLQFNRVWSGAAFSKQRTHLSDLQGHANKATCPLNTEDSL